MAIFQLFRSMMHGCQDRETTHDNIRSHRPIFLQHGGVVENSSYAAVQLRDKEDHENAVIMLFSCASGEGVLTHLTRFTAHFS